MSWKSAAIMATTTFGAGVFALPYLFLSSGWIPGVLYLFVLGAMVSFAHELYRRSLIVSGDERRIIGLASLYLGFRARIIAWVAVLGSLLLTLFVYLILAERFIGFLFPSNPRIALLLFWLLGSLPLIISLGRFVTLELLGTCIIIILVAFLVFGTDVSVALSRAPAYVMNNLFFPFGVILFALSGWTAVEPVLSDSTRRGGSPRVSWGMTWGTLAAAILYLVFVVGILGRAETITEDTFSGLTNFSRLHLSFVALLGLFAIWTSYMPIALEARNIFERDSHISRFLSTALVLLFPVALYASGFNSFIAVLDVVGGVFVALSYILILLIAKKALRIRGLAAIVLLGVAVVFALAALYEIYYFVTALI